MIEINLKNDIKEATKKLTAIQKKQIPFATAVALTKTAQKIKAAEVEEMKRVFDRPTRFTLNSMFVQRATKSRLYARVWLKDYAHKGTPATKYLAAQMDGGNRRLKGFEVLLQRRGILPKGYYTVPGKRARLDKSGNISKGLLNQILSYSGAQRDKHQNTKQGRRGTKARFVVFEPRGSLPGGIWSIHGKDQLTRPVLIFVKNPNYQKRFNFTRVWQKTYNKHIKKEFDKAMTFALKSSKYRSRKGRLA